MHRVIAAGAVIVHMVFVAFTVLGGFIAWLLPGLLMPHIAAALWGSRMAVTRAACPLSNLENWGRSGAGLPELDERGFVAHYFEDKVYPARWARRVEFAVGGVVVASWIGLALR